MEPRQSTPEQTARTAPVQPEQGHERALSHITEMSVGSSVEKELSAQSASGSATDDAQTVPVPTLPVPAPLQGTPSASDDTTATPLVAADEDLIEKEWVDKAKKVILETKDDPYRREQEVKKIQLDYVKKRYGRDIGVSSD